MYVSMCVYIYICMCIYIYIYIYICVFLNISYFVVKGMQRNCGPIGNFTTCCIPSRIYRALVDVLYVVIKKANM